VKRHNTVVAVLFSAAVLSPASAAAQAGRMQTSLLKAEVDAFFDREVASHFSQIPAEGPLPDRVHGAITTGEFSWGTYVRSLAAYAETRGTRAVAGRDIVPLIGRVGIIESAKGSKAFSSPLRPRPRNEPSLAIARHGGPRSVDLAARPQALL
jgi:hypothetical protein